MAEMMHNHFDGEQDFLDTLEAAEGRSLTASAETFVEDMRMRHRNYGFEKSFMSERQAEYLKGLAEGVS